MAIVTSQAEIDQLKTSGRIAADVLNAVMAAARPGVTTAELNTLAEKIISDADGRPSFKGFQGYPTGLCVSVNEQVVHGIPSGRQLQPGDVVGLDVGVDYHGWYTDTAVTVALDPVKPEIRKFLEITNKALTAAIRAVKTGAHIGDIGAAVERVVGPTGYGIITQLVGHGVGRAVHEPPQIPNVGRPGTGPVLQPGVVLAIEPMLSMGQPEVQTLDDRWTVVTEDGSIAGHFEHTVVLWQGRPLILTARS